MEIEIPKAVFEELQLYIEYLQEKTGKTIDPMAAIGNILQTYFENNGLWGVSEEDFKEKAKIAVKKLLTKKAKKDKPLLTKKVEKLLTQAVEIEQVPAKTAGQIAYQAKALVQVTFPHRDPKTPYYRCDSGKYSLIITADPDHGIPYGTYPRLITCWLVTEIVRTNSRRIVLGKCFSDFLRSIGVGLDSRTRKQVEQQIKRLFSADIKLKYNSKESWQFQRCNVATKAAMWWDTKNPDQFTLDESFVVVGEDFYAMALNAPFPIDLRALAALKQSPMALDIYMWLTLRMCHLAAPYPLSWPQLKSQFGPETSDLDNFRTKFKDALKKVRVVYPHAKLSVNAKELTLFPSPTHVQKAVKRVAA